MRLNELIEARDIWDSVPVANTYTMSLGELLNSLHQIDLAFISKMENESSEQPYLNNLQRSIASTGMKQPIVLRPARGNKLHAFDGNHRIIVAKRLGLSEVPVRRDPNDPNINKVAKNALEPITETFDVYNLSNFVEPEGLEDEIGAGYFARVHNIKDDPHSVAKISKTVDDTMDDDQPYEDDPDGYLVFLRALANDKEMQDNIHMPQIRKAAVTTDERIHAEVERLESLNSLPPREMYEMFKRYYPNNKALNKFKVRLSEWDPLESSDTRAHYIRNATIALVNSFVLAIEQQIAFEGADEYITYSTSAELNLALKWINALHVETGFGIDMGPYNIMVRRTPYGIIPVITDPLGLEDQ